MLDGGVGALVDGVSGAAGLGAAVLGPEVHVGACVVAGAGVVDGCASAFVRTARPTRSSVSSPRRCTDRMRTAGGGSGAAGAAARTPA